MSRNAPSVADVSEKLKSAILHALHEEKTPKWKVYGKAVAKAAIAGSLMAALLYCIWPGGEMASLFAVCSALGALFLVGFLLYAYPQPRLTIRGHWSVWVFGKLLILMTSISALQLILCPHFAVMHFEWSHQHPFHILESVTDHYMSLGGMRACMFLCGLTFSIVGGLFGFSLLRTHFSFATKGPLSFVILLSLLSELPVIVLQLTHHFSGVYFGFWALGTLVGFVLLALLVKRLGEYSTARVSE